MNYAAPSITRLVSKALKGKRGRDGGCRTEWVGDGRRIFKFDFEPFLWKKGKGKGRRKKERGRERNDARLRINAMPMHKMIVVEEIERDGGREKPQ